MTKLKLFGPLRSGTNYLGHVIELNYKDIEVQHNIGAWKHGPPVPTAADGYLLTMKSPFAWIDSMLRYKMVRAPSLTWLAHRWNDAAREIFSFSWRETAHLVRYEDIIKDFTGQITLVGAKFNLEKDGPIVDELRTLRRGGDFMKGEQAVSTTRRSLEYYINRIYLKNFSSLQVGQIRSEIDSYLVHQLSYEEETYA